MKNEKKINLMLCSIIFLLGIFMSYLIPSWQTPDELTHLSSISQSLGNDNIYENIVKDFEKVGIEPYKMDENTKVNINSVKTLMFETPSYSRASMLPQSLNFYVIKHLPATIGIVLGIILHLPSFWVMQLGELFALCGYVIIIYFSLKYIPIKKYLLFFISISPMAIQQASSLNYDALLLPMCFFFISYVLYLKFECSHIKLKECLITLISLLIVTYIKPPYILLGTIVFLIPINKCEIQIGNAFINENFIKKWRVPTMVLLFVLLIVGVIIFRNNMYIQVIYGMIMEWKRSIYLIYQTIRTWGSFLVISSVGNFGWLDLPISIIATILFYLIFSLSSTMSNQKDYKWKKSDYYIIIITFIVLCFIITSSLVNHTVKVILFGSESSPNTYNIRNALYLIPYIGGLQGRYYLPFIMLPFLLIPSIANNKSINNSIVLGSFIIEVGLYIYIALLILNKFWI